MTRYWVMRTGPRHVVSGNSTLCGQRPRGRNYIVQCPNARLCIVCEDQQQAKVRVTPRRAVRRRSTRQEPESWESIGECPDEELMTDRNHPGHPAQYEED